MELNEIIVNNEYEKLFDKYLGKNDVFNVINELSEIENIEIYKLLNIYKIIYFEGWRGNSLSLFFLGY